MRVINACLLSTLLCLTSIQTTLATAESGKGATSSSAYSIAKMVVIGSGLLTLAAGSFLAGMITRLSLEWYEVDCLHTSECEPCPDSFNSARTQYPNTNTALCPVSHDFTFIAYTDNDNQGQCGAQSRPEGIFLQAGIALTQPTFESTPSGQKGRSMRDQLTSQLTTVFCANDENSETCISHWYSVFARRSNAELVKLNSELITLHYQSLTQEPDLLDVNRQIQLVNNVLCLQHNDGVAAYQPVKGN